MPPPLPIVRGQGNALFRTTDSKTGARRGQTVPYDVNGAPTGASGAAEDISFTPAGNVAATDVQAAIVELDTEKVAVATLAEQVQDLVGAMLANGANITVTYDDPGGTATIAVTGTLPAARMPAFTGDATSVAGATALTLATVNLNVGSFGGAGKTITATVNAKGLVTAFAETAIAITASQVTDFSEATDDRVAVLIQNGTGITWSYDDGAGTLTPTVTITQYTDEMAQDAVGAMIDGTLVYVDGTPLLTRAALTGDATAAQGSNALTLATVNASPGTFGSATKSLTATVNAKGLITSLSEQTVTPAVGSITGLGTGVATALAVNVGSAGAFVTFNGAGGTPSSLTLTNATGLPLTGLVASTTLAISVGSIELGHASDTTITRVSAGVVAIEGANILVSGGPLGTPSSGTLTNATGLPISGLVASTTLALGVGSIELGHASDTTIARSGAGDITIEGNAVYRVGGTDASVADGGTGRSTSTTAYALLAAGTTATGAHQTLAAGATTEILVGGGASALPAWTTATGSGAPVRATSPSLVTPVLGTPTSGTLTNCTGLPISSGVSGLGTGIATFLATPSSANLATAITDETGTAGSLVFSVSPTFTGTAAFASTTFSAQAVINSANGFKIRASAVSTDGFQVVQTNVSEWTWNALSGGMLLKYDCNIYGTAEVRAATFRLDQTPTSAVNTATHYVTMNFNGTDYKVLLHS